MIPNQWYAILESRHVRKKPVGIVRLGERLVLWRDGQGQIVCMENRCAHRGVSLSLGSVQQDHIACRYHGLRYNRDGACTLTPCAGDTAIVSKALRVPTRQVREQNGLIWLYWGEPGREPQTIPWIDEIPTDPQATIFRSEVWPFNYVRILENNLDAHHWAFLHSNIMVGVGEYFEKYEVEVEGDLIRTWGTLTRTNRRKDTRQAPWDFQLHHKMPNLSMIQVTPHFRSLIAVTPVDDYRSWVHIRCYQTYLRAPILRYLTDHYCINFLYAVPQYLQDFPVFQEQNPRHTGQGVNRLLAADRGIGEYLKLRRRMLLEAGIDDDRSIPINRTGGDSSPTNQKAERVPRDTHLDFDNRNYRRARDQGTQGAWGRAASWVTACLAFPMLLPATMMCHYTNFRSGRHLPPRTAAANSSTTSKAASPERLLSE